MKTTPATPGEFIPTYGELVAQRDTAQAQADRWKALAEAHGREMASLRAWVESTMATCPTCEKLTHGLFATEARCDRQAELIRVLEHELTKANRIAGEAKATQFPAPARPSWLRRLLG